MPLGVLEGEDFDAGVDEGAGLDEDRARAAMAWRARDVNLSWMP